MHLLNTFCIKQVSVACFSPPGRFRVLLPLQKRWFPPAPALRGKAGHPADVHTSVGMAAGAGSERAPHRELVVAARHGVVGHHLVLLVEQVVDLEGEAQPPAGEAEVLGQPEVVRVPGLLVVGGDVGRRGVAFAHVDEAVVEPPGAVGEPRHGRAAVPGDVGDLAAVGARVGVVVGGVGEVLGALVGVVGLHVDVEAVGGAEGGLRAQVDAAYLDVADVHHHPSVLAVAFGHGDYLVPHLVEVGVRPRVDAAEDAPLPVAAVVRAEVVLGGVFGFEVDVADVGVVEVVEGGHAEDVLVERPEVEAAEGGVGEERGRGEAAGAGLQFVRGGLGDARRLVPHEGAERAGLPAQPAPFEGGGGGHEQGVAAGAGEVPEVGFEGVPLVVGGERHVPPGQDGILVCRREVRLLLPEAVVGEPEGGVRVEVAHVVVGVLGVEHEVIAGQRLRLERALREGVAVPLALGVFPDVVHYRAGYAALGVVVVGLGVPFALGQVAEEPRLGPHGLYVAVLAHGGGVPGHRAVGHDLAVAELVTAGGVGVFHVGGQADVVAYLVLPQHRGVGQAERAGAHGGLQVVALAALEPGTARAQVDGAGGAVVARGLEYLALLAVVQGDFLHVVHGELAEVYLPVLRVAQLDAVVEHAHVVGAHAADVHRLQPRHAAVVLDLHAAEVADGIGHRVGAEGFELLALQLLRGDDLMVAVGHHLHLLQSLDAVKPALCRCRGTAQSNKHDSNICSGKKHIRCPMV